MKPLLKFLTIVLILGGHAFAQEPENIRVRIQAVSASADDMRGIYFFDGRQMRELLVPGTYIPDPVVYRGPNPLTLFEVNPDPENEGLPYRPVAQIRIPADEPQVILMLSKNEGQLRGAAIPLRERGFPTGAFLVFNFSGQDVVLMLNEDVHRVANGRQQIVRLSVSERKAIPMVYRFAEETEQRSFVSTSWFFNPDHRYLLFFFREDDKLSTRSLTWFDTPDNEAP